MKIIRGTTKTSYELGHDFREEQKLRHENPEKYRGLSYGHADLDNLTGGLRIGEFVVLAGAQKAGKTTAAMNMAVQMAKQVNDSEKVMYVSLEMGHDMLAGRVLSNFSDIEVTRFRDYKLTSFDWDKLDKGVAKLDELPMLWNVGARSISAIESFAQERDDIRVIVLDYFQLMTADTRKSSKRFEELEDISLRLKSLALTKKMSILAISQQSREAMRSFERQKDPNTMAGTQSLVRDCDLLILLLPYIEDNKEVSHLRKVYVSLSRSSASGETFNAFFSGRYNRFGAITDMEVENMPEPSYDWTNT